MITDNSSARQNIGPAAIAMAVGPLAVQSLRDFQQLLAEQVHSGNERLLGSLEEVVASADPTHASQACANYLTASVRASMRNVVDWNSLLVRVCHKAMTSVHTTGPVGAKSADS